MSEGSTPIPNRDNEVAVLRRQLRPDFLVLGSTLLGLGIWCSVCDPSRTLRAWSSTPGWTWLDEIVMFMALSHVVMLFWGHRRSLDLKREFAERRAAQRRILRQLHHDDLTDLPNRSAMWDLKGPGPGVDSCPVPDHGSQQTSTNGPALPREALPREPSGDLSAAILLDLNRFQEINGAFGHDLGDKLLQAVARRLQGTLTAGHRLYRWGGNEFAVITVAPGHSSPTDRARDTSLEKALTLAERLHDALEVPFAIGGLTLRADATIGLALAPGHGTTVRTLIRRAELALNAAKARQRPTEVFDIALEQRVDARVELSAALRRALEHDELTVHYQPLGAFSQDPTYRAEALVRWEHPGRGLLPPSSFLDVAESTGLVHGLTRWVLARVLDDLVRWRHQGLEMTVAVNLSARNLLEADLPEKIRQMLRDRSLTPDVLELEITESTMMRDPARSLTVLRQLRALGVRLTVDDFGTGHSSLAYLCNLPVSTIKIDRTFVQGMCSSPTQRTIVRSTVDLARKLHLQVVAEGVDSPQTWSQLAEYGCTFAQGYWLSPPVPAEQVPACLERTERQLERVNRMAVEGSRLPTC